MRRHENGSGVPIGARVLDPLPDAVRERVRHAVLLSKGESDLELADKIQPRVAVEVVMAMRERLVGLGVIEKPAPRSPRPHETRVDPDNFELFPA